MNCIEARPLLRNFGSGGTDVANKLGRLLRMLLTILIWPLILFGQESAKVTGKVTGIDGGPMAGAKVILSSSDEEEAKEKSALTVEDGSFSFSGVPPGSYVLRVEASGFETYETLLEIGADAVKPLKVKMKLKTVEEEVTVRADLAEDRVEPDKNIDATKLDETFFKGLPTPADDIGSLIQRFISPAAQGSEGVSIVVDGVEGGELDMPSSAVRNVKINRNPYSAEFQHPGRGRAEVTTKHGHKHRYEGSLAFFTRNSMFDARNAFATTNPNLDRKFVVADLGGPLPGHNGTFFLAGQRLMDNESAVVNAVTPAGPFITNVPAGQRHDHLFLRTQWSLSPMQTLSVSYTFSDRTSENNSVGGFVLPEQGYSAGRHTHRFVLDESATISPRLRNDLIFSFRDQYERSGNPASGPAIVVNGAFSDGPSQTFLHDQRRAYDVQDEVTYYRGKQTLLLGAKVHTDAIDAFDASNFGGTFEFASLPQFLAVEQGQISSTPYFFRVNQGVPHVSYFVQQTAGFAQDEVRVAPSLSLTFGLRYDWQSTVNQHANLSPRFAFAFAPGKKRKTVFRGGAGIFYDNLPRSATQQALLLNGVRLTQVVISNPSFPDPFQGGQVITPPPSIWRIGFGLQSPYLEQVSGGVEQQVGGGAWLSLEYSYTHGLHLLLSRNVNAPLPFEPFVRPDPNFLNIDEVESMAFLRSHALTATFRGSAGRYFKGYAQYIFSKSINDTSGTFSLPVNNYDLRPEIGPADFDRRHRLNLAGIFQLPRGIRLGTILSAASGAPYNITTGFDSNGDTLANDRPPGVTRNTGRGPATVQLDLRLSKIFALERETPGKRHLRRTMEISLDAFNALNHTNVNSIVGVQSSLLFGRAVSAADARTLQMSVKYTF